ncbi:MAG: hypothetical protein ACYDC2_10340, partial [Solirubrobacteraceae bacterium]
MRASSGARPLAAIGLLVALACLTGLSPTAQARTRVLGLGGWRVLSSANTAAQGGQVSQPGFA